MVEKKPDFIGQADEIKGFVLWDAKFHDVLGSNFAIANDELEKYRNLKKHFIKKTKCNDVYIVFMVIPKFNNAEKMCLVDLDQFEKVKNTVDLYGKPATSVKLDEIYCYDTSRYRYDILKRWNANK